MHQTCVFTRLPITSGERCRLVLIASHYLDVEVLTESTSLYKVLTTPFQGIYNDYGFINPDEKELKRLVKFAKKLGIKKDDIGNNTDDMASNIGHQISYEEVRAKDERLRVNFCLISERAYQALNQRLEGMRKGIDEILLPQAEKAAKKAMKSDDDFLKRILKRGDHKNFYAIGVAKVMSKLERPDLARLAMHGLDTSSSRHHMTELYYRPESLEDNFHEIGEIQVLSDFLSEIRGFWSPQSGQGHDRINVESYRILESLISNGVEALSTE